MVDIGRLVPDITQSEDYQFYLARIQDLAGDGWHQRHNQQAYEELYRMLIDYGIASYRAAAVLTLAYCAAQADQAAAQADLDAKPKPMPKVYR